MLIDSLATTSAIPRFISAAELRARLGGISEATLWRLRRRDETFPAAVRLSPGRIGWSEPAVIAWLDARTAR